MEPLGEMDIRESALALPLQTRRELLHALLWSLPREEVIAFGASVRSALQKDIIGLLPIDISAQVLAQLDLEDIIRCQSVSKRWASVCNEQRLWSLLCLRQSPPIRPRPTSRADLALRHRLLQQSRSQREPPEDDEADFEPAWEGADFETPSSLSTTTGRRTGRTLSGFQALDVFGDVRGFRGTVWERSGTGPFTHMQASSSRGAAPTRLRNPLFAHEDGAEDVLESDHTSISEFASSVVMPSSSLDEEPRANYKHLFMTHRALRYRLRQERDPLSDPDPLDVLSLDQKRRPPGLRAKVYDPVSSVEAGGLAGHDCTIYTLQLVHRSMRIEMPRLCSDTTCEPAIGASSTASTPSGPSAVRHMQTITSRDWLLTGSRDQTIRLWDMSGVQPMVVKIFHGGHTGTILTLHAVEVACDDPVSSSAGSGPLRDRLMIVSGGADGRICLWDAEHGDGKPERISIEHENSVLCVRADSERIVSCSKDKTIRVFDVRTLEQRFVIGNGGGGPETRFVVNAIALSKDYIVSVSGDKTVRVWDIRTGALLAGLQCSYRGITSVDFQPASPYNETVAPAFPRSGTILKGTIVAGSADATINIFHLVAVSHSAVHIVDALDMVPPVRDMTFSEMLVDEDAVRVETARLLDHSDDDDDRAEDGVAMAEPELRIELQRVCCASCVCPPGRSRLDGSPCWRCQSHTDLVRSLQIKDSVILSGGYDSTVKIWDRTSGKMLADLPASQSGRIFAVAGDRLRIVCAGLTARLTVWDLSDGLDTSFVEP